MNKLRPEDLIVSSFEPLPEPSYSPAVTTDPTPATHCFVCGPTDVSCQQACFG